MTIRVSIKLPLREGAPSYATNPYDTYHAFDDGVSVGAGGELRLVSDRSVDKHGKINDTEFHIYAAGAWLEATGSHVEDGEE